MAIRLASVPEFVNRTCSTDSKRAADQLGQFDLQGMGGPDRPAPVELSDDRITHCRHLVAEQASGVVAQQIDAAVAIDVDQHRTLGALHTERERFEVQDGASVPAWHHRRCRRGHRRRPRPTIRIRVVGGSQRSIKVE
jgi:hypothetical protein